MRQSTNRLARKDESGRTPGFPRRSRRRLQWATAVAMLAVAATAVSAQAATGGLSTTNPSSGSSSSASPPSASAEESELLFSSPMRIAGASWYGPGLYGRHTACGETLRANTLGVAHRSLPCGTTVKFAYRGQTLITQVIDRGPYVHGRSWDLTSAASKALGLEGVGQVRYAVAVESPPQTP